MKKLILSAVLSVLSLHAYAERGCFEVGADWLYWKDFQDNLEYAAKVSISSSGGDNTSIQSTVLSPDFEPNSGFRLFADYLFCQGAWDVGVVFTHLHSSAASGNSANVGAGEFITLNSQGFPIFNAVNSNNIQFASLDESWKNHLDYLDLDLRRTICVCRCFDIAPHMGLRGVWLRQKLHLDGIPALGDGTFSSDFTATYDGYGLEGGLHGNLKLCWGFSLLGHLGGSLLYARIDVDESLSIFTGSDFSLGLTDTIYHLSPMLDAFIGLAYQGSYRCYPINLHAGWEQHIIMNASHFSVFNYADLTLQGLTLGGSIGF